MYELFPRLAERRKHGGAQLSGGEQQMLAVGRALLLNGALYLMDEPSEGLAPTIVDDLIGVVHQLVSEGSAVLVVEQNLRAATSMAATPADHGVGTHRTRDDRRANSPRTPNCNANTWEWTHDTHDGTINVASVGSKFMGRAHSNAWLNVGAVLRLRSATGDAHRDRSEPDELAAFAERWGWQQRTDDWRRGVTDDAVDLVDIGTPNNVHAEQAIAALEAGKHVACEKPLAGTLTDAEAMAAAAAAAGGQTFVWYNYRRVPAVALAHQLVAAGALGRMYHARAVYLQSWGGPTTPLLWRFQGDTQGRAHGDLNAHIIDAVRFVTGEEISSVEGAIEQTFIEERAVLERGRGGEIAGSGRSPKRRWGRAPWTTPSHSWPD